MENGAFYLTRRHILETYRNRLVGKVGIFRDAEETAIDIDDPADWEEVERHLTRNMTSLATKAKPIKMIISDFDESGPITRCTRSG